MANDPYTLVVALDSKKSAKGTLYIDDGHTFDYRSEKFIYSNFSFQNNKLKSQPVGGANFETKSWLERVIILGIEHEPKEVKIVTQKEKDLSLDFFYNKNNHVLSIRKPGINIATDFEIHVL